jgi:hypothetical protein
MPTALRFQGKECLELADTANELFVKTALIVLSQKVAGEGI